MVSWYTFLPKNIKYQQLWSLSLLKRHSNWTFSQRPRLLMKERGKFAMDLCVHGRKKKTCVLAPKDCHSLQESWNKTKTGMQTFSKKSDQKVGRSTVLVWQTFTLQSLSLSDQLEGKSFKEKSRCDIWWEWDGRQSGKRYTTYPYSLSRSQVRILRRRLRQTNVWMPTSLLTQASNHNIIPFQGWKDVQVC